MGEKQTKPFQLSFNGLLKVDFQGSHVYLRRWPDFGSRNWTNGSVSEN